MGAAVRNSKRPGSLVGGCYVETLVLKPFMLRGQAGFEKSINAVARNVIKLLQGSL